ncbi:MAG: CapA family protein [Bacillota bacterium]|nr:CapA family protein [Bacillota bacterium]
MITENLLTFSAVGDVYMAGIRRWPDGYFVLADEEMGKKALDKVAPYFLKSDVNFCNLEGVITNNGRPIAGKSNVYLSSYPSMVEVLKKAGINIVSLANNHILDYRWEAIDDTIARLDKVGIKYSGAGKNRAEARKPALVEKNGMTIGVLSYTTNLNLPMGFKASENKAGLNPTRVSPFFLPDHVNMEDIKAMQEDISKWHKETDFLAISCHWGVSDQGTETVARHQEAIAHYAIDAGVDLVMGHHTHALQPLEIYKGKAIAYSLGNFSLSLSSYQNEGVIMQCAFSKNHNIKEFKFLPLYINKDNQPAVVSPGEEKGKKVVTLMEGLCAKYGVDLKINSGTGEVICCELYTS